ncbi:DUF1376 domain-containing protein [Pseudomonas amygdali pv. lachrymans]|nr:DUF1376 domain-containing protein [Pseudomonas amygdali pv. lachrymans]
MAALPYMQFYVADYLADTSHLTTEEHGAYMLLLFNYWQTGKALPKQRLHRIARIPSDQWPEIESVLSEFFEDSGEAWIHLRVERDIETVLTSPRGKKLPGGDSLSGYKGYVYFVTDSSSDIVKIGYSKNPWARLNELRRSHGENLSVVATVKTVEKSESSVHASLSEFRKEGEWFWKSSCISDLISSISDGKTTTVVEICDYVAGYVGATTATTNTDTDTDTDTDKNIKSSSPSADDLFPKFWKIYPNKKGKAAAEKAWKKLKVTDDLFTLIAQGLAKQCASLAWTKDGGQFIPHPATWLNGKRWEDEVQPASNVHQFPQSRHTGFDTRDYKAGLTPRGDGTYDF